MERLFRWHKGSLNYEGFKPTDVIFDVNDQIIGIRFKSNEGVILDYPVEYNGPNNIKDFTKRFLNGFIKREHSPWHLGICTVVFFEGEQKLKKIVFGALFNPVDNTAWEHYTSFYCNRCVIRIDLTDEQKAAIDVMNSIIYGTDFIQRFGIISMERMLFGKNKVDGAIAELESYKIGCDDEFVDNFIDIGREFESDWGIDGSILSISGNSIFIEIESANAEKLRPNAMKLGIGALKRFPSWDIWSRLDDVSTMFGVGKEFGFCTTATPLPSNFNSKLFGFGSFVENKEASDEETAGLDGIFRYGRQSFRRYYRLNKNTYLVMATYVPYFYDTEIMYVQNCLDTIFRDVEMELLETCRGPIHLAGAIFSIDELSDTTAKITITRRIEIDASACGEENQKKLKDGISEQIVDAGKKTPLTVVHYFEEKDGKTFLVASISRLVGLHI